MTPFSAAAILVIAIASPLCAQGIEVFGGYSTNADYVQNRPAILVADQKVSPFFSHGSGPTGFEASFKHDVRNGLGIKVDVSGYSDTFRPGPAAYCQPDSSSATGIVCGTGLTFQATGRAFYVTAGPDRGFSGSRRSPVTLYLDTSSLVKLYVQEVGSDDVRNLVARAVVVTTSIVAYPETRAALAHLRRSGDLTPAKFAAAKRTFEEQWPAFLTLEVTAALGRAAGEFAGRYALRGFDALHLASFEEVARRAGPPQVLFSSFDDRLNKAARDVARRLAADL